MEKELAFKEAVLMTEKIIERFEKIEGKPWRAEGAMIELSKQIGDLARIIMMQENYYFQERSKIDSQYFATKEKIADELADILYAVIRIARYYKIDLLEAHIKARQSEDAFLKSKRV